MKIPPSLKWKYTGKTLGQGGQAVVAQVTDGTREISGTFALKGLSNGKPKKAYERFAREIEAIKKLRHPSIIQVIDHSNPTDEFQFYVMEFVEGAKSLKSFLNGDKNPYFSNPVKSLGLFIQLVEAIDTWSKANIIHRDLSPANILILPDGSIKVIDFGICQVDDRETITLTDEGVGTANYMAPECESGASQDISITSDFYSAGKILWSAITSKNAFSRESSVFGQKSMSNVFPNAPETWHLHHIFKGTIRGLPQDRCQTAESILSLARRVQFLILSGYPPLELIKKYCPICGIGTLGSGQLLHMVFGNPNPPGIVSCQCDYCGFCFAIDRDLSAKNLQERQQLS